MSENRKEIREFLAELLLFKPASEDLLDAIIDHLQVQTNLKGEHILVEGDDPDFLYVVYRGQAEISNTAKGVKRTLGKKKKGDFFGFEILEEQRLNETTITAHSKTVLLLFDRQLLLEIFDEIPSFKDELLLLYESYLLSLTLDMSWKYDDESITLVVRRHWYAFLRKLIPGMLVGGAVLAVLIYFMTFVFISSPILLYISIGLMIFMLVWFIWTLTDWLNDYSIVTDKRAIFMEKIMLLYDSRQEIPLNAIMSISTKTDYWGRMFDFGDVIIQTYAGTIFFPKVSKPAQITILIKDQVKKIQMRVDETEKEKVDDLVKETLGLRINDLSPEEDTSEQSNTKPPSNKSLMDWLSNLFLLREVHGDILIYRTHWFILLKRIYLPVLLIAVSIGLIILRGFEYFTLVSLSAVFSAGLLMILVNAVWLVYGLVDWRNDHYVITRDQIVDVNRKPFGKEEKRVALLRNIQSIEFERLGVMGLMLNFGTVFIKVGESTFTFDYVYNPSDVQRELFKRLAEFDYQEKLQHSQATEKKVSDWIESYHRVLRENKDDLYPPNHSRYNE